jgi:hypothetical protein
LSASTTFSLHSPLPYSITTGFDENGDTVFNDRPFGIKRNSERGAWRRQVDMSMSWTIPIGKLKGEQKRSPGMIVTTSEDANTGDIGIDTKHKYSLRLSVTANNIFNQRNWTNFVGVLTSPLFGKPVMSDNSRRIDLGLKFSF